MSLSFLKSLKIYIVVDFKTRKMKLIEIHLNIHVN